MNPIKLDHYLNKKPTFRPEWVFVTPEMAREWLKNMHPNRPTSRKHIDKIAAAIASGRYRPTHQGGAFDLQGRVCDAAHRLHAIVKCGIGIWMLISRGLDEETIEFVDSTLRVRTASDAAAIKHSMDNSRARIAMARVFGEALIGQALPDWQVIDIALQNADALTWAMKYKDRKFMYSPLLAALAFAWPCASSEVEKFADMVTEGVGLEKGTAAHVARVSVVEGHDRQGGSEARMATFRTLLLLILAHLRNERRSQAKDGEGGLAHFVAKRAALGLDQYDFATPEQRP